MFAPLGCSLLLMSCLWKSACTRLPRLPATRVRQAPDVIWGGACTPNNGDDTQRGYVADTLAYAGELFLMSCCMILFGRFVPGGIIRLSEMLPHRCVWLASTLALFLIFLSRLCKQMYTADVRMTRLGRETRWLLIREVWRRLPFNKWKWKRLLLSCC